MDEVREQYAGIVCARRAESPAEVVYSSRQCLMADPYMGGRAMIGVSVVGTSEILRGMAVGARLGGGCILTTRGIAAGLRSGRSGGCREGIAAGITPAEVRGGWGIGAQEPEAAVRRCVAGTTKGTRLAAQTPDQTAGGERGRQAM